MRKSPAVLQGPEPEIPVFESLHWHGRIVSAVLSPKGAAVKTGARDIVPVQQSVGVKRAELPEIGTGPEALRIPVNHPNSPVPVQYSHSTIYPAGSHTVIRIQRQKIFPLRTDNSSVPRRRHAFALLPDDLYSLPAQRIHLPVCSLIGRAIVHHD